MRNIFLILILLTAGVFINKSSAQVVILKADTVSVPCISTDTFMVPVRLDNFTDISGLQFTLQWDTARLKFAFVSGVHPLIMSPGFDTTVATVAIGKLTFAWTDLAGVSIPSDSVLFNVAFTRIGGPPAPVSFVDDPTAIAVFDNQFNELNHQIKNGLVKPIDDELPTITCPAFVITGAPGPIAIPNIAPTISDNCGTPVAGWKSAGATIANFPNDPDASGALFNVGTSTVTYTATDAGGNTATCSFDIVVEFSVSTTDLTLIANPNNLASCGETVTIDILAFNFDSIAGLQFSMDWLPATLEFASITNTNAALNIDLNNFNLDSTSVGLFSFAWTSSSISGSSVPSGEVLFTLTYNVLGSGTVAFGNNPTQALAFTGTIFPPEEVTFVTIDASISVTDTVPPTITCPADITVQAPGAAAVSGIGPASLDDNCAVPQVGWSVTGATSGSFPMDSDASGSLFNQGSSTVTYTTTDAGGNTATCSFNVTVEFGINTTDLSIVANSANASCGGSFTVPITALNFETIAGVQFTINWDPALFQFTSVADLNLPLGIDITNFNIDSTGSGFITFAWTSTDLNGLSVNNGDLLFNLNFNLLNNTPSTITFGDDPTLRVAFDGGSFLEIPMMTFDGQVSIVDSVAPVIECPASVTVDAPQGQLFATVTGLQPVTLTDNCGDVPALTYSQAGATANTGTGNADGDYNAGATTVIYTATDANGNTATCSFQVVVNADTPIILQLDTVDLGCSAVPTQVTVNVTVQNFVNIIGLQFGLNWDPAVLELQLPVPVQYITAGPSPLFINVPNGTLAFFGGHPSWPNVPNDSAILVLTFNVLDANALTNTNLFFVGPYDGLNDNFDAVPIQTINGAFTFTLDNVPPTLTCPQDTVLSATLNTCSATYIPVAPMAFDDCSSIASTSITPDTTIFYVGAPTVLTYMVTDEANNASTCSFSVTVLDVTPPQILTCPTGPIFGDANSLCQANVCWTVPTFEDACGAVTIVNDYDPCGLFSLDTTLVNYTATDLSGNQTTCSFEVVVRDVTAPSITCPSDTILMPVNGCDAIFTFAAPIATDDCDQNLTVLCNPASGTLFTGITTVTCAVLDNAGNAGTCTFEVTVADTIIPVFPNGCPANLNVVSAMGNCGANPSWQAPIATDNCDQNLTIMTTPASGGFLAVQAMPYVITYTATDDLGNSATCTFTVTVSDSTKPVLSNCPSLPIIIVLPTTKCDTVLNWTAPTVSDNCGLGGVVLVSNIMPGAVFTTGDTMVVYTATDASGNSSTCSFFVSVKDVVPPVIDCPTAPINVPVPNPCGVVPVWSFPMASDNCTPDSSLVIISTYAPGDTFPAGATTFVITIKDASGNFDECAITVNNIVNPRFDNVPGTVLVNGCNMPATWSEPIAVDLCPPFTIDIQPLPSGSVFPFGTTVVTYTATDTLMNTITATFNVVVSEDVAPVITCPVSPIVVNVGGVVVSDPSQFLTSTDTSAGCRDVELFFNLPNATDNCVTPTVSLLQGIASGSKFPLGFNNLVFQAIDSSGNLSQCAVNIEVVALPTLDPVVNPITACAGDNVAITATNIPGAVYTWNPGLSTTNILMVTGLSTQNDGVYTVSANVNGCLTEIDSAEVIMTMAPMAVNDLEYEINPGETITFPSVLDNDFLSPAFDFGICGDSITLPGLVMNTTDGTFTYTAGEIPGMVSFLYSVCSKTCDLEDEAAVTILIKDTKCIFIPNIITPNGDDANDYFTIPCIDTDLFRENQLVIYSQWGDQVFEASPYSNDPALAWRGTLNGESGKDLPDGVYFYIFKPGPNIPPMKGFVEVFR